MVSCKGPTNSRVYTVAVYFRGERLAKADGSSIQQAEMNAANIALNDCSHLFPHLDHQKKIMEKSFLNQGKDLKKMVWEEEVRVKRRELGLDTVNEENSRRNDEIIKRNLEKRKLKMQSSTVAAAPMIPAQHVYQSKPQPRIPRRSGSEPKEEGEISDDEDEASISNKPLVDYESISDEDM